MPSSGLPCLIPLLMIIDHCNADDYDNVDDDHYVDDDDNDDNDDDGDGDDGNWLNDDGLPSFNLEMQILRWTQHNHL